jgi:hypothetical protein
MTDAGTAIIVFLFAGFALSLAIVRGLDLLLGLVK